MHECSHTRTHHTHAHPCTHTKNTLDVRLPTFVRAREKIDLLSRPIISSDPDRSISLQLSDMFSIIKTNLPGAIAPWSSSTRGLGRTASDRTSQVTRLSSLDRRLGGFLGWQPQHAST